MKRRVCPAKTFGLLFDPQAFATPAFSGLLPKVLTILVLERGGEEGSQTPPQIKKSSLSRFLRDAKLIELCESTVENPNESGNPTGVRGARGWDQIKDLSSVASLLLLAITLITPFKLLPDAPTLNTYAVYDDQAATPNIIGHMYLYTGNYPSTTFQVRSVSTANTNIAAGGIIASGAGIGPLQPAALIGPFSQSYFQISSDNPMNGVVADPLLSVGNDQDTFVNAADTNNYVGTVFMTWMRACAPCSGNDFGDDMAVINAGNSAITAQVRPWTGAVPGGSWGGVLVTSPSIPAGGVWMWSPSTASSANPNLSGGTLPAAQGNYRIDISGGKALFYFGDDFTPYQGSNSNRNDLAHVMVDMATGRKTGTNLVGPADWRHDSGAADADIIVTNQDPSNTANFTIYHFVANTPGVQWPASSLDASGTWTADATASNLTLAPGQSYFYNNDVAGRQWATFFRVVSNNGVALNAWEGVGPIHNNFNGGDYMDSADLQAPWGNLFKWGMCNTSGSGTSAAQIFYAIAPQNNTTVNFSTTSGTLSTPAASQTNNSGGPAGLRFVLNETASPDNYYASVSSNNHIYAWVLNQSLSNPTGGGEVVYSLPPPNLSQLVVSKSVNVATAAPGNTVTYTLVASNFSQGPMSNCRVWDTLPPDVSLASSTPAFTQGPPPSNFYVWNLGTLNSGQSVTVSIAAAVVTGLNGDLEHNTATGDNSTNQPFVSDDAPFTVVIPGVNLQKSASVGTASPGNTVTYTLDYFNSSPCGPSTPPLDLLVEGQTMSNNDVRFYFEIANNSSAAVNLSDLKIVYWLYDTTPLGTVTSTSFYGGDPHPFVSGWTAPAWTASLSNIGPVMRPDNRDANIQVTWSTNSTQTLPAGVSVYPMQFDLSTNPPSFTPANETSLYYSRRPNGESTYVSDAHFALYYQGTLVKEYSSPGVADPNTGCEPWNWVQVNDTVPAQITYVGSTPSATVNGNILSWFVPCIQCQANANFNWWGTVNTGASGTIHNTADFTANTQVGMSNDATVVISSPNSPTFTPTASPTRTPSPSPSASPTASPSNTPSFTYTATPSFTVSSTVTPSFTPSVTATISPTATPTFFASPTSTFTVTNSFTSTDTPSATPSNTPSPTQSFSFTASPSTSSTPTFTATPSQTYSFSPSPSFSSTPSATVTLSPSDTNTPSATYSSSPTLSVTPSPSPSRTATASNTPSFTTTLTASPSPSPSVSSTFTPSFTITLTPVPQPIYLTVTLYNAAGEVVRHLYQGSSQDQVNSVSLSSSVLLAGSGQSLKILFAGLLSNGSSYLAWNGQNDSGQWVSDGTYYIKEETTDPFGRKTSVTGSVYLQHSAGQALALYNSAGEKVLQLDIPSAKALSSFSLSASTLVEGANGQVINPLSIQAVDSQGNTLSVSWDGKNQFGAALQAGVYTFVLSGGANGSQAQAQSLSVLSATAPTPAPLVLAPNPLGPQDQAFTVFYTPSAGSQVFGRLYNLAGECVAVVCGNGSSGRLGVPVPALSGGIYLFFFQQKLGGTLLFEQQARLAVAR